METAVNGVPACRLSSLGDTHLQLLLRLLDATEARQKWQWEQQEHQLRTQLLDRETELQEAREQVRVLQRQAEEQQRVHREAVLSARERLAWLKAQLEILRESHSRAVGRRRRREPETSPQTRQLSEKLEEFQRRSRKWEEQRASSREHLASLEANRRLLAAKCQRFQNLILGGVDVDLIELEEVREEDEATRWGRCLEKQRLLLELAQEQKKQQVSEEELCELRAELQATFDLLQATQLEGREWQRHALRLQEQLPVWNGATWLEENSIVMEETTQQQPEGSNQQGALQRGKTAGPRTGMEAAHLLATRLQDVLQRMEDQLCSQEHAGKLKDDVVQVKKELERLWSENSSMAEVELGIRKGDEEMWQRGAPEERKLPSAAGWEREHQVAKMQTEALLSEKKQLQPEAKVLDPVRGPPAHKVPRAPECERKPPAGVRQGSTSICREPARTRDPDSACGVSAAPEHGPRHHGNSHKGVELEREEGGVGIFLDTPDFRDAEVPPHRCWSLATNHFFQEEERRIKGLEQQFDFYMDELCRSIQGAVPGKLPKTPLNDSCYLLPATASPGTTGI